MVETLVAPDAEVFPNRRRWTVQQCYRLADAGELVDRWELIDGEILYKMGQKPAHSYTLIAFAEWLASVFGYRRTRVQLPIRIDGRIGEVNEPELDIAVVTAEATTYADRLPGPDEVLMVVEIADSSVGFDLGPKALLYAMAGVPEYWVVDLKVRQVHVHLSPALTGYRDRSSLSEFELISCLSHSGSSIRIGDLLPPKAPEEERDS